MYCRAIAVDQPGGVELAEDVTEDAPAPRTKAAAATPPAKAAPKDKAPARAGTPAPDGPSRAMRARRNGGGEGQAKYAHPENPSQTWSGRGRRPRWVTEQIESGKSLEDLLA